MPMADEGNQMGQTSGSRLWRPGRLAAMALLISGIALVAVACGGDEAPATKAPAAQATQPPAATQAPTSAPAAKLEFPIKPRANVTRAETLVFAGPTTPTIAEHDNMNPFSLGGLGRVRGILNKTVYEYLYLYNHNTAEEIPWLAEAYKVSDDFMKIDVTLRNGIEWADGKPFTSSDVQFTLNMLRDTPALTFASDIKEWVKDVQVVDDRHFTINMNKPNARFFFFYFIENSEIHITVLPKHVWEGKDPSTFNNFDPAKGWPLGTGPYAPVSAGPQIQTFDRNDNWWAAKAGFAKLPKPLRVTHVAVGSTDTWIAMMVNNEIDVGHSMQPGQFVASKGRNSDVVTWGKSGPVWGAPDACLLTVGVNTAAEPFNNADVRWALNYAIDRDKFISLGYEDSVIKRTVPYSSYGGLALYENQQTALIAKYKPDDPDPNKVAARMQKAGYTKDAQGFWTKGGKRITEKLHVPSWLRPMGPVLAKQMKDGGFDIEFQQYDDNAPFFNSVRAGNANLWSLVHCGSSREPHGTLQHFHSRFASPIGTAGSYIWANSNYSNPEYDAIIDKMDAITPRANDPAYLALVNQALEIYLRDLPQIYLSDEMHVRTFNNHYWKGWMNAGDPYVAPYQVWAGFLLAVLKVEPTGNK